MVVGGLSGGSKQTTSPSSVIVKILVRNASDPSIEISCFNKNRTENYRNGISEAHKITDIINVIIDAVDRASLQSSPIESTPQTISSADELLKLAQLKEQGILTEEEFNQQKAKLLNSNSTSPTKPEKNLLPPS